MASFWAPVDGTFKTDIVPVGGGALRAFHYVCTRDNEEDKDGSLFGG
jgi:hypothetical protein